MVNPGPPASGVALQSISVNPNVLSIGNSGIVTVTLTEPAGTGGVTVALSSSNRMAAPVPPSVTIPQGATSATFNLNAGAVNRFAQVTLTASYLGVSKKAGLFIVGWLGNSK
jgi:hypothetical protein